MCVSLLAIEIDSYKCLLCRTQSVYYSIFSIIIIVEFIYVYEKKLYTYTCMVASCIITIAQINMAVESRL